MLFREKLLAAGLGAIKGFWIGLSLPFFNFLKPACMYELLRVRRKFNKYRDRLKKDFDFFYFLWRPLGILIETLFLSPIISFAITLIFSIYSAFKNLYLGAYYGFRGGICSNAEKKAPATNMYRFLNDLDNIMPWFETLDKFFGEKEAQKIRRESLCNYLAHNYKAYSNQAQAFIKKLIIKDLLKDPQHQKATQALLKTFSAKDRFIYHLDEYTALNHPQLLWHIEKLLSSSPDLAEKLLSILFHHGITVDDFGFDRNFPWGKPRDNWKKQFITLSHAEFILESDCRSYFKSNLSKEHIRELQLVNNVAYFLRRPGLIRLPAGTDMPAYFFKHKLNRSSYVLMKSKDNEKKFDNVYYVKLNPDKKTNISDKLGTFERRFGSPSYPSKFFPSQKKFCVPSEDRQLQKLESMLELKSS